MRSHCPRPLRGAHLQRPSISFSAAISIALTGGSPNVGYVLPSLAATATNSTFSQSVSQLGAPASLLTFTEQFGTAFKTKVQASSINAFSGQSAGTYQNVPGSINNSEAGFII